MTLRAVIFGLLLGMLVAAFGYFNDWIVEQSYVATNLAPLYVYGLLLIGLLVVNPLLGLLRWRRLTAREWCVVVALMLVACSVPGPGMMWYFSNTVVMPHHFNAVKPGWTKSRLMEYVPPQMLVDAREDFARVVYGFDNGLTGERLVGLGDVPWGAWSGSLSFYLPLIALSFIAGICLVVVVHRQWSRRECLRYPLAEVTWRLVDGAEKGGLGEIFHNRLFWLGFAVSSGILLVNGLHAWWPESIEIPLNLSLSALGRKWP